MTLPLVREGSVIAAEQEARVVRSGLAIVSLAKIMSFPTTGAEPTHLCRALLPGDLQLIARADRRLASST